MGEKGVDGENDDLPVPPGAPPAPESQPGPDEEREDESGDDDDFVAI